MEQNTGEERLRYGAWTALCVRLRCGTQKDEASNEKKRANGCVVKGKFDRMATVQEKEIVAKLDVAKAPSPLQQGRGGLATPCTHDFAIASKAMPENAMPENAMPENAMPENAIQENAMPEKDMQQEVPQIRILALDHDGTLVD